ncbi:MAG: extracellular solute-binding protein [Caldilineaceae bacterium]
MHNSKLSRRSFLQWAGVGSATLALAACAPAMAPGGDTGASGEAAPAGDKPSMSVATFDAVLHDWQREFAKRWADDHPDVDVQIESVVYAEMAKLQLARAASGTMWDLVFSGIKWFPFSASKNMFLNLDDFLANREDANLDDFFATALEGGKLDGSLYGLPYEIHPGNPALIAFNVDKLDEAGLTVPADDDWTVNDYAEMCVALTKSDENFFGTNYLPGNYYDFESIARAFNTDILNADRTQLQFATDEGCRAAAEWITKLRTELNCAPNREAAQGLDFTAGAVATSPTLYLQALIVRLQPWVTTSSSTCALPEGAGRLPRLHGLHLKLLGLGYNRQSRYGRRYVGLSDFGRSWHLVGA